MLVGIYFLLLLLINVSSSNGSDMNRLRIGGGMNERIRILQEGDQIVDDGKNETLAPTASPVVAPGRNDDPKGEEEEKEKEKEEDTGKQIEVVLGDGSGSSNTAPIIFGVVGGAFVVGSIAYGYSIASRLSSSSGTSSNSRGNGDDTDADSVSGYSSVYTYRESIPFFDFMRRSTNLSTFSDGKNNRKTSSYVSNRKPSVLAGANAGSVAPRNSSVFIGKNRKQSLVPQKIPGMEEEEEEEEDNNLENNL